MCTEIELQLLTLEAALPGLCVYAFHLVSIYFPERVHL